MGRREEIAAEMTRRGMAIPQASVPQESSRRQEILAEMKRRGMQPSEQRNTQQFQSSDYESPVQAVFQAARNAPRNAWGMVEQGAQAFNALAEHAGTPGQKFADYGNTAMSNLVGGAHSGLNIPSNMIGYAQEHKARQGQRVEEMRQERPNTKFINLDPIQLLPDWLQAWKPSQETHDTMNAAENYWQQKVTDPNSADTQLVGSLARQIPGAIATGNPFAGMSATALGENRNPIEDMLGAKFAQKAGGKLIENAPKIAEVTGKGLEVGKNVATAPVKTIKRAVNKVSEPWKQTAELGESIARGERDVLTHEDTIKEAGRVIEDTYKEHLKDNSGVSKRNVANDLKEIGRSEYNHGSERYNDFNAAKNEGQKRVFKPVQPEFFEKQFPGIRDAVSKETRAAIDNTFGKYAEKTKVNPLTGKTIFDVDKNARSPNVAEYVELQRKLSSEKRSLRSRADNPDMIKSKKDVLRGQANSIERLESTLNDRIQGSVSEKVFGKHLSNQEFWKEIVSPFTENGALHDMVSGRGKVKTSNILETLDAEGLQALKESLLKSQKVSESIGKHDWRSVTVTNSKSLIKALEGDLGRTLPENVRNALQENYDILNNSNKMIEAIKRKGKEQALDKSVIDKRIAKIKSLGTTVGTVGIASAATAAALLKVMEWLL